MSDDPQRGDRPSPEIPVTRLSVRTQRPDLTPIGAPGAGPGIPFLTPGMRPLPEYELIGPLGRGSYGEVWKANGPGGFDVALKFIRLGDEAGAVELRALELMKGIRHAHLLPLFGAWQREDLLIIAMELADRTLYQRLKEVQAGGLPGIPAPELLEYMREAAKGLDFLNDQCHTISGGRVVGIQHKDVKPQNLLLVGGTVKVGDFGLARLLERSVTAASGSMTPAYTAPEFLRGQATRWSDQYCLAVTYCQLRCGRLPFEGGTPEVLAGHALYAPDLSGLPDTERLAVARALAKEPEQRWPSCREFVRALATTADPGRITFSLPSGMPASVLAGQRPEESSRTEPPAPAPSRRGAYAGVALGGLAVLALAAVGVWAWVSRTGAAGTSHREDEAAVASAAVTTPATTPREPGTRATTRRQEPPRPVATTAQAPQATAKAEPPKPPAVLRLVSPLPPLTDPLVVETGKSATLNVRVQRENCKGPVQLELTGLPAKVQARPVQVEDGREEAQLEVEAAEDAATGPAVAELHARLDKAEAEGEVHLTVRPSRRVRLFPPPPLTLESGQARTLVVRLERQGVTGPVTLRLEALPRGVVCRPVTVPADDVSARLELEADLGAAPGAPATRLVAEAKGMAPVAVPFPVAVGPSRHFKARLAEDTAAIDAHKDDPVAYLNRGHTYREAGFTKEAWSDYTKAIRLDNEHKPPHDYAPAYYYRGRTYQDMDSPRALRLALEDYDEALRLDPKFAAAYFQRGQLRQAQGDPDQALKDYDQALKIDPDFTAAYLKRAEAWKAKKDYKRALADYDQALRRDDRSGKVHFGRGLVRHLLGQDEGAVEDYGKALELGYGLAVVFYERGNAWRARKDTDKARRDYEEAIQRDPGYAEAYDSLGHLYEELGDTKRARENLDKARRLRGGK